MNDWLDKLTLTEAEGLRLIELRGGCSCHISPPCYACSEPIDLEEAEILGHVPPMGVEAETTLKTYRKYELGMAIVRPEDTSTWQQRLELTGLYDDNSPHKPAEA